MKAIILLSVLGIITMLSEIFGFKKFIWYIVIAGLAITLGVNLSDWDQVNEFFPHMIDFNNFSVAFSSLLIFITLLWFLLTREEYETGKFGITDHFALILFSLVGAVVLSSFNHMVMLFLGIEILSIPMYILAGSNKKDLSSNEAALKYFMMGAFATGILLFGIALIYGATGTFNIGEIGYYVRISQPVVPVMFYSGVLLILIGLGFKVSAVPFHFWTPDVYEGAPTIITGYMATVVKTAGFVAFYRLFSSAFAELATEWAATLAIIIVLTILTGNILAVYQQSVKRMLAYSGIAQAGYLLLAILVISPQTKNALFLYLASYTLSTLCAFFVLHYVSRIKAKETFDAFDGLGKSHPLLALVMTVSMLSLAGIPPAIGFFAKFYLFSSVLEEYTGLVIIAVIGSLISVYYYFRPILAMYARKGEYKGSSPAFAFKTILLLMTILIIFLGIVPGFLIDKL